MIRNRERGFTLLELLISITILGLIATLILGAFRIGVRAWEKGEKDVEIHQRERVVLDLVRRQLSSVCLRGVRDAGGRILTFEGDGKSMQFVSHVNLVPSNAYGLAFVNYEIRADEDSGGENFTLYEKNVVLLNKDTETEGPGEDEFICLINGVGSLGFEYYKEPTEEEEEISPWRETWDMEEEKGFPLAVRVMLETNEKTEPIYVVARMGSTLL